MIIIKTVNHIQELASIKLEKDTCPVEFRKLITTLCTLRFLGHFLYFISPIVDFRTGQHMLTFTDKNKNCLKSNKTLKFQLTF